MLHYDNALGTKKIELHYHKLLTYYLYKIFGFRGFALHRQAVYTAYQICVGFVEYKLSTLVNLNYRANIRVQSVKFLSYE